MDKIITEDGVEVLEITETITTTRKIQKEELKQDIENYDVLIEMLQAELDATKEKKRIAKDKLNLFKK